MTAKYLFYTSKKERSSYVLAAIVLALIVGVILAQLPVSQKTKLVKVGVAYVPPGRIFGLSGITGFVSSSYYYESSLVNYSVPVADSDYILLPGYQESVHLPGYSNDRYTFIRTGYISGSGWFETWEAPNGGYIAFLHLSNVNIQARPLRLPTTKTSSGTDLSSIAKKCILFNGDKKKDKWYNVNCLNDDRTGLVVNQLIRQNTEARASYEVRTGGYYFGRTGWPTDPYYGNGQAGPYNAHLCVIYDQAGSNWLNYVTYQRPPARPVRKVYRFIPKAWNAWTQYHHKRGISPFYGHDYSAITLVWERRISRCHGVTHTWVYDYRNRVTYERFQDCKIYSWTQRSYGPKVVAERHIR